MYGLVFEELNFGYFTNMEEIFGAMQGEQLQYNWLISDYECNYYPVDSIRFNEPYAWIDGEALTRLTENHDIQFIWGVFSAFPKEIKLEEILTHELPFADGNKELWSVPLKMQNPLAEIEIIPWDSCLLVLKSNSTTLIDRFKKKYLRAMDLYEYNLSVSESAQNTNNREPEPSNIHDTVALGVSRSTSENEE